MALVLIKFDEPQEPIGFIRFSLGPDQIFRVEDAIDTSCRKADQYTNITTEDFQGALASDDTLRIRFEPYEYYLHFVFNEEGGVVLESVDEW